MGQVLSGGESRPITAQELRDIDAFRRSMARIPVPTLHHRDNPHEYLFFAFHDGTGQDLNKPKLGLPTNVGWLSRQAQELEDDPSNRIATHYAKGIGSQSFAPARWVDGALAMTWEDGIEEMYTEFANQAKRWTDIDPLAQIRVAGMGYSRGGVQEAGFHRLVNQYGIADPRGLNFGRDADGNITVESRLPPLVPPGQVAQVALLLDPVATNMPRNYDSRLPPSVISSAAAMASTEQRELFQHLAINDIGITPDGRAMNGPVPGGHSNIGGGNSEPGVEILIGNVFTDYLNLLSDRPLFEKRPVPDDLSKVTIYQAQGATAGFGLAMDHDGQRNTLEELANCKIVDPCKDSEPVNATLASQFDYRTVQLDPVESIQIDSLIHQAESREATRQQAPVQSDLAPASRAESASQPQQDAAPQSQTFILPIPEHLQDFRHPEHPQHGRYQGLLREVHRMEEANGIPSGPHSERMAAAWVDQFGRTGARFDLDHFEMRGHDVVALERRDNYFQTPREASLNADQALSRPVEQVSADWAQRAMPHLGQAQVTPQQASVVDARQLPGHVLRHPDRTHHGQFEDLRSQVADLYAKAGIVRDESQLERATAAVALDMQKYGLDRADRLFLTPDRSGMIGPDSGIGALQGQYPLQLHSQTSHEALQQAPEQSFEQWQQMTQQQVAEQQQQQAAQQQGLQRG